jgi:hypothetical protein
MNDLKNCVFFKWAVGICHCYRRWSSLGSFKAVLMIDLCSSDYMPEITSFPTIEAYLFLQFWSLNSEPLP